MIKKVLVIIVLIGIGGGVALVMTTQQKTVIRTGELSERSKEYIKEQRVKGESDLQYARLDNKPDTAGAFVGTRVQVGDCFSFVMVFRVTNPREESECNMYFGIEKPKGFITAYARDAGTVSSVEGIDGVSMRHDTPEKYAEEKRVINGVTYLIYRGKEGVYEANVFGLHQGKAIIFNLLTTSPDTYDKELDAMLGSLEFGGN